MTLKFFVAFSIILCFACCEKKHTTDQVDSEIDTSAFVQVGDHTYRYVSELGTVLFGDVPCNSLVYLYNGQAVVFDTPSDNEQSTELINHIQDGLNASIEAVVINHHHIDCLGGLQAFHDAGVSSYSLASTAQQASEENETVPQNTFTDSLTLMLGNQTIKNYFPGEAHTNDNIVSWIPQDKVLFGGCMVKELDAGVGNITEANMTEWSNTIETLKQNHPDLIAVIPGHGEHGGIELLDFTIGLFSNY